MSSTDRIIAEAQEEYTAAKARGDKVGMAAAHAKADVARGYTSMTVKVDGVYVQKATKDVIAEAQEEYMVAQAKGDKAGMAKAHAKADAARGYATVTIKEDGTYRQVPAEKQKIMYREDDTRIQPVKFIPPGYKMTRMVVAKGGVDLYRITFAVSPSSFNESRSNNVQLSKTNGGWFAQKMGPSPVTLNFDGFMLDIEGYLEKHQFLDNWKMFLEDKRTSRMEYENEWSVKFICLGRQYHGYMQSIQFNTSSSRPFLHQYSGVFISLGDEYIYKPDQLKVTTDKNTYAISTKKTVLGSTVYQILAR